MKRLRRQRSSAIIEAEKDQQTPLRRVLLIFFAIVVLSLLRGGKAGSASVVGVESCDAAFWWLTVLTLLVMFGLAVQFGRTLSARHEEKVSVGYRFVEGDIVWAGRNLYLYPLLSAVAGLLGGLLGIGGGMIMGPLLLELGMLPNCTQATSATTVMITSGAATFQFMFLGMMLPDYSAFFAVLGLVSTFVGQKGIIYLVERYETSSLIVFSIALVMVIAVVLMTIAGVLRIIKDIEQGTVGFSDFCEG
jgi:uncharacterized membrane protein YfcA